MKRIVLIMLALTMMLCAFGASALAAAPTITCAPGAEGGAEYLVSNGNYFVFISKPGEYTIEDWTSNETDRAYIKIDGGVQGEVVIHLKNVHLKTQSNAVQWVRNQHDSGNGSRTLRLVFEDSEMEAFGFHSCVAMEDRKGADNVLIIDGEAPKLNSSKNDCIHVGVENGSARVEIAASDAQITAPGGAHYTDAISMISEGGPCEVLVTGERAQLIGACNAFYIAAEKAVIRLTGDGAKAAGAYSTFIGTEQESELILGAGVTLSAANQLMNRWDTTYAPVKVDGETYPGIQVMAADNAEGEDSELIGEFEAMTRIDDEQYRYLRTIYIPKEPDDGGNAGGGAPDDVPPGDVPPGDVPPDDVPPDDVPPGDVQPDEVQPDDMPETGDAYSIELYIVLLAASVMGSVMLKRRKAA